MPPADRAEDGNAPSEIELKFAVRPEDLPRLRRLPLFAGAAMSRRSLNGAYYDTPDHRLRQRALALRVRKEGRRYVQTLKADGGTGAASLVRSEWQWGVRSAAPDLSFPELRKRLGDVERAALGRVFTSRVTRSTRLLRPTPGAAIEVSFDRGSIETPAGETLPVCEIELELKEGEPKALFEVAHALSHAGALRIEARSKAARGYSLADRRDGAGAPAPERYRQVELDRDMPAEEALAALVRRSLEHMLANDPAALAGDAEGVHQMRVALRRLRATLGLFKTLIPEAQRMQATGEMKWLAGALGAARNWDIFAELAAPLGQALPEDRDVAALLRAAGAERERAYGALRAAMASTRYTELVLRLMEWVELRFWRQQQVSEVSVLLLAPLGDLADGLIEKRYKKARKLAKRFDTLDAPGRHRLRIALKKLRYGVDSFEPIYAGNGVARLVKRVSRLQGDLGLVNDLATAETLMQELPAAPAPGEDVRRGAAMLQGWLARVMAENERRLSREVARFLKAKPFWKRPKKRRKAAEPEAAAAEGGGGQPR